MMGANSNGGRAISFTFSFIFLPVGIFYFFLIAQPGVRVSIRGVFGTTTNLLKVDSPFASDGWLEGGILLCIFRWRRG